MTKYVLRSRAVIAVIGLFILLQSSLLPAAVAQVDPMVLIASKRLAGLGFINKKFVLEQDNKPKAEQDSFYARFEEPVKINGVTFASNVSVGIEKRPATKIFKAMDEVAVIRVEVGQMFMYQGIPCMTVALKKGLMLECVLAKDYKYRTMNIPARTHLHFRPASGTQAKPLYISQLRTDLKVGNQSYKKGQSLKITDKGLTTNFNPLELSRLNGGK